MIHFIWKMNKMTGLVIKVGCSVRMVRIMLVVPVGRQSKTLWPLARVEYRVSGGLGIFKSIVSM